MIRPDFARTIRSLFLLSCIGFLVAGTVCRAASEDNLGSKKPYAAQQSPSTYEAPPAGFSTVFTQIVARHGSRGLSSASNDLAIYNMWLNAQAAGGLTKAGERMGVELLQVIRANALLGYNVPGITAPGYGNLTQRGIDEHTGLAQRLASRVGPLFTASVAATQTSRRQVIVSTSGVNRAIDSGNFFVASLAKAVPGLSPLIVNTDPLTAYPMNQPAMQAAGVNRFQLYFHKLAAKTDLPAPTDPLYPVYQSSLEYQNYLASDPAMLDKVNRIVYSDASHTMARAVLETAFTKSFVDQLDNGTVSYANTGTFNFTSDDGKFTTKLVGDGGTVLKTAIDAANSLYAVYSITPAMKQEVKVKLDKFLPAAQLPVLAYLSDAQDFYQKGPGIAEASPVTYKMSQGLLDDFFREGDAIAAGNLAHSAKLRFTHAEIIIPFAARLGIPSASMPVPAAQTYTYQNSSWRGEQVAPLASNVQWDLFSDGRTTLVKMYYNEKETDFPCESARFLGGTQSHYYTYAGLKTCYGYR